MGLVFKGMLVDMLVGLLDGWIHPWQPSWQVYLLYCWLEVEVSLYPMYAKVTDISCFNSGVLSTVSGILDFSTLLDMVLT